MLAKHQIQLLIFLSKFENIQGVSIDDRTIKKGDLFIAFIGDKFDGHNFIEKLCQRVHVEY